MRVSVIGGSTVTGRHEEMAAELGRLLAGGLKDVDRALGES